MFSDLLFSNFSYEIKCHVSYIKQNSPSLATTCKRSHVDKMNDAPVGPFRVPIDLNKNPVLRSASTQNNNAKHRYMYILNSYTFYSIGLLHWGQRLLLRSLLFVKHMYGIVLILNITNKGSGHRLDIYL